VRLAAVEVLQCASVTFGENDGCGFGEKPMGLVV
jgi:hypothetical protein